MQNTQNQRVAKLSVKQRPSIQQLDQLHGNSARKLKGDILNIIPIASDINVCHPALPTPEPADVSARNVCLVGTLSLASIA